MSLAERAPSEKPAITAWRVGRIRRSATITPATTLQLDEARLELHIDGPMARAELVWPADYGTRMLAYGPYSDVMERVIECGRYGVGCGPLASSRPHQWQEFKQDGSYRAITSRGELRVLPFGSKFALVHVLTDGGVAWLSVHDDRTDALRSAFASVGKARPRPLTVRYRGRVLELTVASIRGVLAYCRLDPTNDLVLLPTEDAEHVELTIIGDATVTVRVIPVQELGQREELWSDEPPRVVMRTPIHSPPPPPRQAAVVAPARVAEPADTILGIPVRRPAPISCRCKVPADVLECIRFRAQQIADLQPMSPNDPTGWSKKLRRELAEGMVALAARGRDIRGVGRELRQAIEKVLGYRLTGGPRSFRYAIAAYRLYSKFVRLEGRQTVFVFSELLRPDSELMRWLRGGVDLAEADDSSTDGFVNPDEDADFDPELGESTDESENDDEVSPDLANDDEVADDDTRDGEADPLAELRRILPPKPKFLYYTPKYHVDLFERDRQRRIQLADAAKKKDKKDEPS
ncbi:DNA polymerase V family protein [Nannocystis pusilla]|uniref:Uncharacterized protein n=1 Tax=Nannocystis pusilla TaxID=889268 RepID=A0ABS7TN93_9BACT|nr:DNA polymerase V family protein [Nannocystis pusilla]MBZ5709646.1 hypothetical protein [Nannocystis pusilla]